MEVAFARTFVERDAGIYIGAMYERVNEHGQREHIYLHARWIWDWWCTATCTRLSWVEWSGRGRSLKYRDLKVQKGGAGSRRGGEIGEEHRSEISEGCLRVLQIRRLWQK